MTLSLQALHSKVTQLAQNNGELTGKFKNDSLAAHKEGSFQGLTVSSGARPTERAFAQEVLKHLQHVSLNDGEVRGLTEGSRYAQSNFELHYDGKGVQLRGLHSDQLTLKDAKILLDAALRQQGREEAPPLPPRSAPVRTDRPALAHQHERLMGTAPRLVAAPPADPYGSAQKQQLSDRLKALQDQLSPGNDPDRYQQGSGVNRFRDIQANKATAVREDLNANYVQVGAHRSIACQYPLQAQLESHMQMLFDNRTPVLAVLASASEIDTPGNKMPDYFRQDGQYGQMKVKSTLHHSVDLGRGIQADVYHMTLSQPNSGKKGIVVPVVHVSNWPDKQAVGTDVSDNLARLLEQTTQEKKDMYTRAGSSAVGDDNKLLPVIHCRAGVGRTGQVIGTMAMNDPRNGALSVEDVVGEMRQHRNGIMVQTQGQLDELVNLAQQQGRSLLRA